MASAAEDREILRNFYRNMTPAEGFDETKYSYQWEYRGANGIYLWQSKTLGWEVVQGSMPENPDMRDASGYCTMGDTVLMRMPKSRYNSLDRARQALVRQTRGDKTNAEIQQDIDEKISRLVGHAVNMSFKFTDQRDPEIAKRKEP